MHFRLSCALRCRAVRPIAALCGLALCASLGAPALPAGAAAHPTASVVVHRTLSAGERVRTALSNLAPQPAFAPGCSTTLHSANCAALEIQTIDNARQAEGLPIVKVDPATFSRLSPIVQVFAATNLERIARGLPPVAALTSELNAAARSGARRSVDPSLPSWKLAGNRPVLHWGANWAGGLDPLEADYLWMYDDGVGYNIECNSPADQGCWAHRLNILLRPTTVAACGGQQPVLVMGVGISLEAFHGSAGIGELLAASCGGLPPDTTVRWTTLARRIGAPVH